MLEVLHIENIAVIVEADILWLLRRLRREKGMSMLFVSHDDRIARAFCDRRLEL